MSTIDFVEKVEICHIDETSLLRAEEIYIEAFPPEERRQWDQIAVSVNLPKLRLDGIFVNESLAGIITTWDFGSFIYIEHFAVERRMRGRNIGGAVIAKLARRENRPLLIEVEPSGSTPDADRRIRFYRNHGFEVIDKSYVQPPYVVGLPSVPLWLMSDGAVDPVAATALLHAEVYGKS